MDSIWYLAGCAGFFWVVLWSLRDFSQPTKLFWPFDARWMKRPEKTVRHRWQRPPQGRERG